MRRARYIHHKDTDMTNHRTRLLPFRSAMPPLGRLLVKAQFRRRGTKLVFNMKPNIERMTMLALDAGTCNKQEK